jgi:hypothetical protein
MNNKDFAIFILTHGRPDNVKTTKTLLKAGYTGRICYIVDNEDNTVNRYIENFGKEKVFIFDKKEYADKVDEGNNFDERRTITHARNACFDIAEKIGVTYFMQLDDDYYEISYKLDNNYFYKQRQVRGSMDIVFDCLVDYYNSINALSISFAQCGDFIGGAGGSFGSLLKPRRKAMNTFLCSTERPFNFIGRINEDVNTYTSYQSKGNLFLTIPNIAINQKDTQSNKGGMTDLYLDSGTYIKSFYTVMCSPSSVKIKTMGAVHKRLHHSIKWSNTVPMIVKESLKKL